MDGNNNMGTKLTDTFEMRCQTLYFGISKFSKYSKPLNVLFWTFDKVGYHIYDLFGVNQFRKINTKTLKVNELVRTLLCYLLRFLNRKKRVEPIIETS